MTAFQLRRNAMRGSEKVCDKERDKKREKEDIRAVHFEFSFAFAAALLSLTRITTFNPSNTSVACVQGQQYILRAYRK